MNLYYVHYGQFLSSCLLSCPARPSPGAPPLSDLLKFTVSNLNSKYMIFADAVELSLAHEGDSQISQQALQEDKNTLVAINSSCGPGMNPSKCVYLRFSREEVLHLVHPHIT